MTVACGYLGLSGIREGPVGQTDSELPICKLPERLHLLRLADGRPVVEARLRVIEAFAAELRGLGPTNFLYCDGEALFAHADWRHQDDGTIRPLGLWRFAHHCATGGELPAAGLRIESHGVVQDVVLVTSVPLTTEDCAPLACGEILVARDGHFQPA